MSKNVKGFAGESKNTKAQFEYSVVNSVKLNKKQYTVKLALDETKFIR